MSNNIAIGKLFGLEISAKPNALFWALVLWVVLSAIAFYVVRLPFLDSLFGGLVGVILHYVSEVAHHLGHAGAARSTGYPMRGMRFWGLIASSLYPKDEPPLPAQIHIRRALGGPTISFVVTVIALLILLAVRNGGGLTFWLALWFFLDNLLVFFLGAFLPLSFTDGGTLVKYWGSRSS